MAAGRGARKCTLILLVEDEKMVRKVTSQVLQFAGYRVVKARNATEALRAFKHSRETVTLLLTDVVMPGRNGRVLARELQALSPSLRTIFTSGYPENAITQNRQSEPGVFYLPKPFSADSLIRKVREVLEAKCSRPV